MNVNVKGSFLGFFFKKFSTHMAIAKDGYAFHAIQQVALSCTKILSPIQSNLKTNLPLTNLTCSSKEDAPTDNGLAPPTTNRVHEHAPDNGQGQRSLRAFVLSDPCLQLWGGPIMPSDDQSLW